jgi:hypothetical protein
MHKSTTFKVSALSFLLKLLFGLLEAKKSFLDKWATNRNSLFTYKQGSIHEGKATHDPWQLEEIEHLVANDHFSNQIPIDSHFDPQDSSYSRLLHVSFTPFKKLAEASSYSYSQTCCLLKNYFFLSDFSVVGETFFFSETFFSGDGDEVSLGFVDLVSGVFELVA